MDYYIDKGTRIGVEVGTERKPEVVRWTVWGNGDLQQSYLLLTKEGGVLVDPVEPTNKDALDALVAYAGGSFAAIVNASARHDRSVDFFRKRFKIPLYGSKASPPRSKFIKLVDEFYDEDTALPGGKVSRQAMRKRYGRLDKVPIDLILNGHNPLPLDDRPKAALKKVLADGEYEAKPGVTFMWMDWT